MGSIETGRMFGDINLAKKCGCIKWKKNIQKLDMLILFADEKGLEVSDIMFFQDCPWCGKKLKENCAMVDVYGKDRIIQL